MTLLSACLVTLLGLGLFALSLPRHWRQLRSSEQPAPSTALALRVAGGVALLVSLLLCLTTTHPTMAVLVWIMQLAFAAALLALFFAWCVPPPARS